jgi:hypothetical protein
MSGASSAEEPGVVCQRQEEPGRRLGRVASIATTHREEGSPFRLRERHAFPDARRYGLVHEAGLAQVPLPLGTLGRGQVTQTRFTAQQLARGGQFEPLSHGFLCLSTCNGLRHGAEEGREFGRECNSVF